MTMRRHLFALLLACAAVTYYYCINSSSSLTNSSSSSSLIRQSQKSIPIQPLIEGNEIARIEANSSSDFIENIQGTIPTSKLIRHDVGTLPHKHVGTKTLGTIDNCNMEGNRIKHIIPSSALSINWENAAAEDGTPWEIFNDRGNANPEIKTEKIQYVIIKDNVGMTNETITKVDQKVATAENEAIANEGEWMGQDPRVFLYRGKRIIIYHSKVNRQMRLYDHETKHTVLLTICGHGTDGIQKNWTPIVVNDNVLLLMYGIDPLVILQYDVDAGDGVCKLIFGHLPLRSGLNGPYGGTPFVEISFSNEGGENAEKATMTARSFLSMAHTRKGNDLVSPDRRRHSQRVYRPVPVVLHIFCITNQQPIGSLEGCTFAADVYDLWHEVESPDEIVQTKWKKTERNTRSVSFPYDLHLFPEDGVMRMGLEYEDCYSVYEDYEVDFGIIMSRQVTHPIRLELEGKLAEVPLVLVKSTSLDCPSIYSHDGVEKAQTSPMAGEDELAKLVTGKIWIVSHQHSRRSRRKASKGNKEDQVARILDHYPYPIQFTAKDKTLYAPKLCIYIYGSIYQSILSELNETGSLNTAKILHNDNTHPTFSTLEELLSYPDFDPMGIRNQFEHFLTANHLDYPIILVRDDAFDRADLVEKLDGLISQLANDTEFSIVEAVANKGFDKLKSQSLKSIEHTDTRDQFVERYSALNELFESQPLIRLVIPNKTVVKSDRI